VGWKTAQMAKAIHASVDTVKDLLKTPELQRRAAEYEREQFQRLDRRTPRLLTRTVDLLERSLRRGDWKAVETVLGKTGILERLVERALARIAESSPLGTPLAVPIAMDDMTPAQRQLAREFLKATRDTRKPPRILGISDPGDSQVQS